MRRTVLIVTAALAVLAAVPAFGAIPGQTTAPVKVHVSPATAGPHATFRLSFRSPWRTGQMGTVHRTQMVQIQGTRRPGCVWSGERAVPAAAAQQLVRVSLTPSRMTTPSTARTWCPGIFHGSIVQTEHLECTPPRPCPMIEIRPQTIAYFNFRVKRSS
jgi:hypothetical protein